MNPMSHTEFLILLAGVGLAVALHLAVLLRARPSDAGALAQQQQQQQQHQQQQHTLLHRQQQQHHQQPLIWRRSPHMMASTPSLFPYGGGDHPKPHCVATAVNSASQINVSSQRLDSNRRMTYDRLQLHMEGQSSLV